MILFGIYLVVGFLSQSFDLFSNAQVQLIGVDLPATDKLTILAITVGTSSAQGLLFNILPGWLLISRSQRWAHRLVPETNEPAAYIEFTALLRIGLFLVGCYFTIRGLAGSVGSGLTIFLADSTVREYVWSQSASSLVTLAAGIGTLLWSRRAG